MRSRREDSPMSRILPRRRPKPGARVHRAADGESAWRGEGWRHRRRHQQLECRCGWPGAVPRLRSEPELPYVYFIFLTS